MKSSYYLSPIAVMMASATACCATQTVATVCAIKQAPQLFIGHVVTVTGKAVSDGMHGTQILS